jgi:RHS repeat-associated protein
MSLRTFVPFSRTAFPRILLRLGLALALACPAATAWAQKKPKENAQVLTTMRLAGYKVLTNFSMRVVQAGQWNWQNNTGTSEFNGTWSTQTTTGWSYSPTVALRLTPGVAYEIGTGGTWNFGDVKVSAPPGYQVYLNDRPIDTYRNATDYAGGSAGYIVSLVLRPLDGSASLPAGTALSPRLGDLIWAISAGTYSNGLSAGAVQWRTDSLSTDLLDPTSLYFADPHSSEFNVTYHSDGGLLRIQSFQFNLYVRRNSTPGTGYAIEIYSPYAEYDTGSGDGPHTFTEGCYREFRISNPDSTWQGRIKIEKIEHEGSDITTTWILSQQSGVWTLTETSGTRVQRLVSTIDSGTGNRIETATVENSSGVAATKLVRTYKNFGWSQEEMIREVADPDGLALQTDYDYYTTGGDAAYGRLKSVKHPDGSWESYIYDETVAGWGNLSVIYRPWQDSPSDPSSATASNCLATLYSYVGRRDVFTELFGGTETKATGTTIAKNVVTHAFPGNAPNGQPRRTDTVQTYSASGTSLTTTREVYDDTASTDFLGRSYSQTGADGTKVSFLRYKGYWWNYGDSNSTNLHKWPGNPSADTTWGEYRFIGFDSAVQDAVAVNSWDGQSFSTVYLVPNRSTVELDIYNAEGRVAHSVTYAFTGAASGVPSFEFLRMTDADYADGVHTLTTGSNGYRDQLWMSNGFLSGHTYNDGSYVEYTRDELGRDYLARKWYQDASGSYPAQGYIYTHKTFDIAGRVLSEKVSSSATASASPDEAVTTAHQYNLAGLVTTDTAESGAGAYATTYAYANGGRTVTVTLPTGATQITDRWLDGSPKTVGGTGVVGEYHRVTIGSGGVLVKEAYTLRSSDVSSPTSAPRWSKVTTDWAGRTIKEERPGPSSGTITRQYFYDSVGHLVKTTETGLADTLTEYNAWQQAYRTGLDLNADGDLDVALSDRITETDALYEKDGSDAWWLKATTKAYNQASSGTPITQSVVKDRQNKFDPTTTFVQAEKISIDIFGNQTDAVTQVERGSGGTVRLVTQTVTHSDSSTPEVSITRNGLLQKTQSKEGLVSWSYYDGIGRLLKQTNPRTDTSSTARIGYVSKSNRVAWQQDGDGNQTSFGYDAAGQLTSTTNALSKVSYQSYNLRGQVTRSWGETTYPVEYGFDDYGQQTTLSTFRGGTGWTGLTWPGSPGTADTTTWAYDNATGLLTSKTDAASHAVGYTYNARGQLATRTWARGTVSTYSYDSGTAEQTGISYSDSTPAIAYTYNRLGQSATVADVTGTRTFAYSATTTALNTETFPSYFDSRVLTRHCDTTTTGALGRNTGYTLSGASGSGTDNEVSYGYDAYGRFNGIATPSSGPAFTYTFTANSNLIASIAETSGWTETNTYEAHRNLLTQIKGQFGTPVKAQFDFTHDALGRRLTAVDSGEIFARYNSSALATHYGYNDRSEVTSAQSYYGTSTTDTSSPVIDRGFTYAFDNIGNRTSSAVIGNGGGDTHTTTYTNNTLNQVTARAGPGSVDVTGLGPSAATITVNSASTTRQGDYYYKNLAPGSTPAWLSASVTSSLGGSGTRYSFVPPASETHTYDADGNLTADGRWSYTWDAENRLVSMETVSGAYAVGVPRQLIQFKYDYLGRRVRKTVSNWSGSAYVASLDRKFIYNGWNLLAEYDVPSSGVSPLASAYIWGLDLSGNLVDGGGVGGLLAIKDVANSAWHLPYYDANGNLHALIDRSTGTVTAAYEYSPFGETLRATGAYAAANPFRFSTKYTDTETQFLYYGYRYYNPSLGRWLGRDPLGEKGGVHLYAFCRNNGINAYDRLGMIPLRMDDIWDEDMPDADFVAQYQPTWQKVGGSAWYDPVTGIQRNYKGHSDAYYASLVEGSSMGPVGGTINPSLLQQINSTFAQIDNFNAEIAAVPAGHTRFGVPKVVGNGSATGQGNSNPGKPGTGALLGATAINVGGQLLQGAKQNLQFVDNNVLKPLNTIFDTVLNAGAWAGDKIVPGFGENLKNGLFVASMLIGGGEERLLYGAAETTAAAENPIYVLGRQADTAVAKDWAGHSVLDIPDWSLAKNDAFVQQIVDQRATVYLGSPQTEANLFDAFNERPTVFARELEQLKAAGYQQTGDYMLPPGTH